MSNAKEKTVLCPHHNKPLAVKIEGKREIAICECDPNDKRWYGMPVYTKLVDAPAEIKKETEN